MIKEKDLKQCNKIMVYGIVAVASILLFVLLFGIKCINPRNIDWILKDKDLYAHYLQWDAYRHSAWTFPLMGSNALSYPEFTSYIVRNNGSVLELLFKLVSPLLPTNFQYFGAWGLICFILQGLCSVKLFSKLFDDNNKVLVSSVIYCGLTALMGRMYYGTAMSAQWMLTLAAVFFIGYVRGEYNTKQLYCYTVIITIIAGLLSPFYSIFLLCFFAGTIVWDALSKNEQNGAKLLGTSFAISYALLLVFGGQGELFKGIDFSTPLLSLYVTSDDVYKVYVGLGEALLVGYVLYKLYEDKKLLSVIKVYWKHIVSFAVVVIVAGSCLVLNPSINRVIVAKPNAWSFYFTVLETVVVSAFMAVLPIAYVIKYLVKTFDKKKLAMCIAVVLLLQFDNIQAVYASHHSGEYVVDYYELKLKDINFWDSIVANDDIKELVFMYDATDDDLVRWAVDNDKKIVDGAFRDSKSESATGEQEINYADLYGEQLEEPDDKTAFVFKSSDKSFDYMNYSNLHYYRADGYVIGYMDELTGAENEAVAANELCTRVFELAALGIDNNINILGHDYIAHGGFTYGPYCKVDNYTYLLEIKGYNLLDTVSVDTYSEQGKIQYEHTVVEASDDRIVLYVSVDEPSNSFEVVVRNNSWGLVRIDSYLLMPLNE